MVTENVAGIEIENTIDADVFENTAINNTAGILVFDLPIPDAQSGSNTRVFNNTIQDNNHDNFAPGGGIVSVVPPGTGTMVLSTKSVEIFDNQIVDNHVIGIGIFSYVSVATLVGLQIPDGFDPFFNEVYVFDNEISKTGTPNQSQTDIGFLLLSQFGANPIPDLMTDGIFSPASEINGGLCIRNNGTSAFVNLDIGNGFANPSFDSSPHDCSFSRFPEVTVPE